MRDAEEIARDEEKKVVERDPEREAGESGNKFVGNGQRISDVYIFPWRRWRRSMRKVERRQGRVFPSRFVRAARTGIRCNFTTSSDTKLRHKSRFSVPPRPPQKIAFLRAPPRLTRFSVLPVHQTFTPDYFHRALLRFHDRSAYTVPSSFNRARLTE